MPVDDAALPTAQALFDHAACGLLLTDEQGLILRANHTVCHWLGWPCAELERHKRLQDLLTMGGRIFHQTHWAPLLQIQGSIAEVKLDMLHSSGRSIPMMMNAVRRQHGAAVFHEVALFVAEDRHKYERELLSARKNAELLLLKEQEAQDALTLAQARLLQAHAMAEDRALLAEQMIGIVSHDLRNPLTAIQMSAHLLGRGELAAKQHTVLSLILSSTNRANRLIADLLDFTVARIGSGLSITTKPLDLHELVAESMAELAATFPGRTLRHEKQGQGDCMADADRLAQLIGNLVGNAMTYGDSSREVTVTSCIGADSFVVAVHNHGKPVPADLLPGLFEPMVRGEGSTQASQRSVGLGLFIVREIVRAHRGEIAATSSADEGTLFQATFPRGLPSPPRD